LKRKDDNSYLHFIHRLKQYWMVSSLKGYLGVLILLVKYTLAWCSVWGQDWFSVKKNSLCMLSVAMVYSFLINFLFISVIKTKQRIVRYGPVWCHRQFKISYMYCDFSLDIISCCSSWCFRGVWSSSRWYTAQLGRGELTCLSVL